MNSEHKTPPDRWLGCPVHGELIENTFMPMKTLLDDEYALPPNVAFTPDSFVKRMQDLKINIGLVVNLTFSSRYYEGDDLIDNHNLEYKHISCRGFNEAPTPNERDQFVKVCNSFLAKNPGKKIAVHCTHGFNRTGFMICYFLCSDRDWAVDAAVSEFAAKRPPGIYKQEYLNELFNIFGDSDDPVPTVPPRPVWDTDLMIADLHNDSALRSGSIIQENFYEGITDVHLVRDEALKQRIYRHCCQLCKFNAPNQGIAFPGAQPVSMDPSNLGFLKAHRYRVSWKADGCRYMLYIQDEDNMFFLTRSLLLWRVVGLKFPRKDDLGAHIHDTLLDGEMVTDKVNGQNIPRFLIYDVISLNGTVVADQDFDKRCEIIQCVIIRARLKAKHENRISTDGEPFKVADKGFFFIKDARKTWNLNVPHEKDGLIFQPLNMPYEGGTCPYILKWKPPHLNSIDFRLAMREERQNGCIPEVFACLHVSNRAEAIVKFKLDKDQQSYHKYNNKIVEMTLENSRWIVQRERTDKLYANSYETASAVFRSIKQPVTEKMLFEYIDSLPAEQQR